MAAYYFGTKSIAVPAGLIDFANVSKTKRRRVAPLMQGNPCLTPSRYFLKRKGRPYALPGSFERYFVGFASNFLIQGLQQNMISCPS